MTDHSAQAAIRKEINQRLLGIAAAIEGTMDHGNVDLYTPAQILALIVNAIKWAPPSISSDMEVPDEPGCEHCGWLTVNPNCPACQGIERDA